MSTELAKSSVQGDVLDPIEIVVREEGGPGSAWRVYVKDPQDAKERRPLSDGGYVLGGTWDLAVGDAERVAKRLGLVFKKPAGLWLPS